MGDLVHRTSDPRTRRPRTRRTRRQSLVAQPTHPTVAPRGHRHRLGSSQRMMWNGFADDQSYDDGQWHFIHTPERTARPWLLIRETGPYVYQRFETLQQAIDYTHTVTLDHINEPTA